MKVENGVTNFAVYEDATEYYGMAEVTLPEITQISEEVKGAGIAGTFDGTFVGHLEATLLLPGMGKRTLPTKQRATRPFLPKLATSRPTRTKSRRSKRNSARRTLKSLRA